MVGELHRVTAPFSDRPSFGCAQRKVGKDDAASASSCVGSASKGSRGLPSISGGLHARIVAVALEIDGVGVGS